MNFGKNLLKDSHKKIAKFFVYGPIPMKFFHQTSIWKVKWLSRSQFEKGVTGGPFWDSKDPILDIFAFNSR